MSGRRLVEAWWALAIARLSLSLLPWRGVATTVDALAFPVAGESTTESLASGVRSASRLIPGATCLVQALALHAMLARRRRASELKLGVRRSSGFEAHAWLECDGAVVIGEHPSRTNFEALPRN